MRRTEKDEVVQSLRERIQGAQAAFFTDFRGLSVADLTELRRALRGSALRYQVVKNTLARIAFQDTAFHTLLPLLDGPTGLVVVRGDPLEPSRILAGFARAKPAFRVKGGVVGGQVMSREEILTLATLPSREQLLSRLVGALQAPLRRFVGGVQAPLRSTTAAMVAVRMQKEKGSV